MEQAKHKNQGNKYNNDLSTKDIAKAFRADVAKAKKDGILPKELKLSVRTSLYSGGSSINVTIKEVGFNPLNTARVHAQAQDRNLYTFPIGHPAESRFTKQGGEIKETLTSMLAAYNFDESDSMTDYFFVNFYGHVEFNWKSESEWKKEIMEAGE